MRLREAWRRVWAWLAGIVQPRRRAYPADWITKPIAGKVERLSIDVDFDEPDDEWSGYVVLDDHDRWPSTPPDGSRRREN